MDQKAIKSFHKQLLKQRQIKNVDWENDTLSFIISSLAVKPDKDLKDSILNLMREREVNDYIQDLMEKDNQSKNKNVYNQNSIDQKTITEEKNEIKDNNKGEL